MNKPYIDADRQPWYIRIALFFCFAHKHKSEGGWVYLYKRFLGKTYLVSAYHIRTAHKRFGIFRRGG